MSVGIRGGSLENTTVWTTTKFKDKASSPFESMLYSMAWIGMELHRDGTSTLLFRPPFGESTYIFCQGKWKVSETEKNTVIIDTKIPVGYTNIKLKVKNIEAKDNSQHSYRFIGLWRPNLDVRLL